jgi:hypothetical protein
MNKKIPNPAADIEAEAAIAQEQALAVPGSAKKNFPIA